MFLPTLFTREYMAKKCGNCGAPAPDTNSRFCDLCGAPLTDEESSASQGLPVCPVCGAVVSDKIAQFCDVCGAPLAKPICPVCRNIAPSYHSKFCSRCGAAFVPATPPRARTAPAAPAAEYEPEPEPVKIKTRKEPEPVTDSPEDEWDPWTDGDPSFDVSTPLPQQPRQKTDLQRMSEEMAPTMRRPAAANQLDMVQMAEPRKKYSHLPLIADELQADLNRRAADMPVPREDNGQPAQGKHGKKKGLFHSR